MVRKVGLEPTRREAPDFESGKTTNSITSGYMVGSVGLEPTLTLVNRDLNPARLPIPPRAQNKKECDLFLSFIHRYPNTSVTCTFPLVFRILKTLIYMLGVLTCASTTL